MIHHKPAQKSVAKLAALAVSGTYETNPELGETSRRLCLCLRGSSASQGLVKVCGFGRLGWVQVGRVLGCPAKLASGLPPAITRLAPHRLGPAVERLE